jgi:hypothetical protein
MVTSRANVSTCDLAHHSVPRYYCKIRVETVPGAACYRTLGNAMAFRAIIRAVVQRSKAAPLHGGPTYRTAASFTDSFCGISFNP